MTFSIAAAVLVGFHLAASLTVQASPLKVRFARSSPNDSSLEPRLAGNFRIRDCSISRTAIIKAALDELPLVMQETENRLEELIIALEAPDLDLQDDLDDTDLSTYDTFETIYGKLWDGTEVPDDRLGALASIQSHASTFRQELSSYGGLSIDVFCDSDWLETTDNDGDPYTPTDGDDTSKGTFYYDTSGNDMKWTQSTLHCDSSTNLAGMCFNSYTSPISVISLCSSALTSSDVAVTLTSIAAADDYDASDYLGELVANTGSFLLLHELSHSHAIFNNPMDDIAYTSASGTKTAYGWESVTELPNSDAAAQVLDNSDSFAYFAAAMYLNKYTWWQGNALDPATEGSIS